LVEWDRDAVRRILRKRSYTGQFIDGKISVKKVDGVVRKVNNPESSHVCLSISTIIDAQTFESAQKRKPRGNQISDKKFYLLTGLIRSGECGVTMPYYWRKVDDLRIFRQALEKFVKRVTIYSGNKGERKFRIDGRIDGELSISLKRRKSENYGTAKHLRYRF
jgi:Recombinase